MLGGLLLFVQGIICWLSDDHWSNKTDYGAQENETQWMGFRIDWGRGRNIIFFISLPWCLKTDRYVHLHLILNWKLIPSYNLETSGKFLVRWQWRSFKIEISVHMRCQTWDVICRSYSSASVYWFNWSY